MQVIKTKQAERKSERVFIYSNEGLGKSTLAASAPNPIFINIEDGLSEIDTNAYELCTSFDMVMEQLKYLYKNKTEFESIVIDTIDFCEKLIYKKVCQENNIQSISDIPYGGGFSKANEKMNMLVAAFDAIRIKTNMRIILLGHSQIKTVQNLLGADYDAYMPNIRDKHCDLLKAWCDIVGYLHTKTYTDISKGSFGKETVKQSGGNERIFSCYANVNYAAKNRYGITGDIDIPIVNGYSNINKAIESARLERAKQNTIEKPIIEKIEK